MRTLYIHCGLPKTGTTSLQRFLATAREELRSCGFDYPDIGVSADRTAHHNLAREMLQDGRFEPERGGLEDILRYIERTDRCSNIVLSSEGFTHCLFAARHALYEFLRQSSARIDAVFVIFTFRKFWRITESSFLYELRHGNGKVAGGNPFRPAKTEKFLGNLSAAMTELREIVGSDRLLICDVENADGDAVAAFSRLVGIPVGQRDDAKARFNNRIGLKKTALLYRLKSGSRNNAQHPSLQLQRATKARRRILAMPDLPGETFDYRIVPYEDANSIQSAARQILPRFLTEKLEMSLRAEEVPYQSVDLEKVSFSEAELKAIRKALRRRLSDRLPWLAEGGPSRTIC